MRKIIGLLMIILLNALIVLEFKGYVLTSLYSGGIDNTNHGWEVKRNREHRQPDIPQEARDMLLKYNGIYVGNPDKKVIYLTIDLGYENGNTDAILDKLKENNVKATFFIISSYMEKNQRLTDRIINEGHSLQNHTSNYKQLNNLGEYQIKKEIMDLHNAVKQRYGISMKYLRLPYEEWSEKVMKIAYDTGYKTVFWSVACVDWIEGRDASYIFNSIANNYHNGAVILMHAVSKESPAAIDMVVKDLKAKGFEFRVLDI